MPASFSVEYEGRTVEVIPDPIWEQDRVRLVVDGETVAETKANAQADGARGRRVRGAGGDAVLGRERQARVSWCRTVATSEYELDPEPGTRARASPRGAPAPGLYASRYVLGGAAQVAVAIIGFTSLLRLHARDPVAVDRSARPPADRPAGHAAAVVPDRSRLPGWVQEVLDSKPYWVPIVVGVVLARRELKRRQEARRDG